MSDFRVDRVHDILDGKEEVFLEEVKEPPKRRTWAGPGGGATPAASGTAKPATPVQRPVAVRPASTRVITPQQRPLVSKKTGRATKEEAAEEETEEEETEEEETEEEETEEDGDGDEDEDGDEDGDEDDDEADGESEEGEEPGEGASGHTAGSTHPSTSTSTLFDSDDDETVRLHISEDLSLPESVVTESIGIVAARGSGKSYLTAVMVEEMTMQSLPVVVLDPLGVYWGLRSSADGLEEGCQVFILGGDHGDLPLDPASGKAIARWVLEHRAPTVLDLSNMRRADQRIFVADFAEEIFENCKDPLHIIIDEADLFIPQRPQPEDKRGLLAFEDIVRRGRARGLGTTVVTQRPAVINKDVFTQIGTLVVLRMGGPQDLDAIKDWVRSHSDLSRTRLMLASLPALPVGTAWFWSPGWLGVLKKVAVRKKWTFDSSITPQVGTPRPVPDVRAIVNLDVLRESVQHAHDHDPNSPHALKSRIAELERALNDKEGSGTTVTKLQREVLELQNRLMARPAAPRANIDGDAIVEQINTLTKVVGEVLRAVKGEGARGVLVRVSEEEAEKEPGARAAPGPGEPAVGAVAPQPEKRKKRK